MKPNIHPQYQQITVTCVGCGTAFTTGSTASQIRVDICSHCHPFYTGQKKLIDTEGRVEKFEKRLAQKTAVREPKKVVLPTTTVKPQAADTSAKSSAQPKSLREMLQEAANSR